MPLAAGQGIPGAAPEDGEQNYICPVRIYMIWCLFMSNGDDGVGDQADQAPFLSAEWFQEQVLAGLGLPGIRELITEPLERALGIDAVRRQLRLASDEIFPRALNILTTGEEPERGIYGVLAGLPAYQAALDAELGEPIAGLDVWGSLGDLRTGAVEMGDTLTTLGGAVGARPEEFPGTVWDNIVTQATESARILSEDIGGFEVEGSVLWRIGRVDFVGSLWGEIGIREHFMAGYNFGAAAQMRVLTAAQAGAINTELARLTGKSVVTAGTLAGRAASAGVVFRPMGLDSADAADQAPLLFTQLHIGEVVGVEAGETDWDKSLADLYNELATNWTIWDLWPSVWTYAGIIAKRLDDLSVLKSIIGYVESIPSVVDAWIAQGEGLTRLWEHTDHFIELWEAVFVEPLSSPEEAVLDLRTVSDVLNNISYVILNAGRFLMEVAEAGWDTLTGIPEWISGEQLDWTWLTDMPDWIGDSSWLDTLMSSFEGVTWESLLESFTQFPVIQWILNAVDTIKKNFSRGPRGVTIEWYNDAAMTDHVASVVGYNGPNITTDRFGGVIYISPTGETAAPAGLALPIMSARCRGYIEVPRRGDYLFKVEARGGIKFYIDDALLLDEWEDREVSEEFEVTVEDLRDGFHSLTVEYFTLTSSPFFSAVNWEMPWLEEVERAWYPMYSTPFGDVRENFLVTDITLMDKIWVQLISLGLGNVIDIITQLGDAAAALFGNLQTSVEGIIGTFNDFWLDMQDAVNSAVSTFNYYMYERPQAFRSREVGYPSIWPGVVTSFLRYDREFDGLVNYYQAYGGGSDLWDFHWEQYGTDHIGDTMSIIWDYTGGVGSTITSVMGEMFAAVVTDGLNASMAALGRLKDALAANLSTLFDDVVADATETADLIGHKIGVSNVAVGEALDVIPSFSPEELAALVWPWS